MIEALPELPDGVIGFRFSGHVQKDEYRRVLLPPLQTHLDNGEKIRLAIVIDNDFDRFDAGAMWEDLKFGFGSGVRHPSLWERMALVSDADWVRHSIALFGWLVPGDVRVFPLDQQDAATAWLAG
jgi:SpoIIAA-like